VQLVGLPLVLVFVFLFATAASRAVLIFLVATLIALLLNPIVRQLSRLHAPRTIVVFVVFGLFALGVTVLSVAVANILVDRVGALQEDIPRYYEELDGRIDAAQQRIDDRGWHVDLRDQADRFVAGLEDRSSEITGDALDFGQEFLRTAAEAMLSVIAVIVITIYMLLDAPRIGRFVSGAFPRDTGVDRLFPRLERSLFNYVRGQTLTSLVMGFSAAGGIWLLAGIGVWEEGRELAAAFGVIVALTQFAPSIGPIIGSIPPLIASSLDGPGAALGVLLLFVLLHQIEGHIVVPKLLGAAIAVHPLLVIFAVLAGAQLLGAGGILLALPLLAVLRELVFFARERFEFGAWPRGGMVPSIPALAGAAASTSPIPPADTPGSSAPPQAER